MGQGERKNKKIELAFPKYEEEDQEYISKGKGEDLIKYLSTSIDEVTNWFNQYQVDSNRIVYQRCSRNWKYTKTDS